MKKNLYYMIWVDGIRKVQTVPSNNGKWKLFMMIYMSMAMALNVAFVISIIQLYILGEVFYDIRFNIFPGEKLNNFISFFVLYLIGPIILNYFFIYRNNRYIELLNKYKYYDGKLALTYLLGTLITFLIYGIFFTPTVH